MSSSHGFLLFCLCVTSFQPHFTFATSKPSAGLSIRAFVDDSPGSPLHRIENMSRSERMEKLIKTTNARAMYLNQVSNPDASVVAPDNIHMPVYREGLYYAVEFALGSQRRSVKLLLDTGSGLTWTQCEPCVQCFRQIPDPFVPADSASYARLPPDHPLCHGEDTGFTCVDGVCRYHVKYGGGMYTKGIGSMETVHFSSGSQMESYNNFVFGCSDDSTTSDVLFFRNSEISGIFGLDTSRVSLMQQLGARIQSRFSYCLAPFADAIPRPLILRFGEDVPNPQEVKSTLFVTSMYNHWYNLELLDISVGGYKLGFPEHTFQERGPGQGGCLIDSGALVTHIDSGTIGEDAYEKVIRVFEAYYGSKGLTRIRTDRTKTFELCYRDPNADFNDLLSLTFHFNGGDYHVDGQFTHARGTRKFCVAISRGTFATILGAYQQQNKRIIYDGMFDELRWADEDCINDIS